MIIREINNSPVDIKLLALVADFLKSAQSSDFHALSCLSLFFFYPSPTSEVKIYPKGVSLSFSLSFSHLHTFLIGSAKFPPKCVLQLADSLREMITSVEENFVACSNCLFQTCKIIYGYIHCSIMVPCCTFFRFCIVVL